MRKYRATLISQGEFLSLTQTWPKPLKGDLQKGTAFSVAINRITGGTVIARNHVPLMRSVSFGRAMAGSLRPDIREYYNNLTNTWADVAEELEDNQGWMNTVRKCLDGPGLDFNLDYRQGFNLPVAHLAKTKQAAQLFGLATALALHNKALDSAHTNLMTLLALNQAFQQDRLLITEMVQIAIEHIGAGATWEALQTPGWSDAQLKQIEDKWLSLKFIEPMEDSLAMERAISAGSLDELRHSSKKFSDMINSWAMLAGSAPTGSSTTNMMDLLEGVPGAIKARSTHALWHYFWSYEDQLRCLQIAQAHLETLRQGNLSWKSADLLVENKLKATGIKAAANAAEDYEFLDPKILGARTFFSDQTLNNKNGIRRALTGETLKEIVSTAIALKRYQIRNGKNPSSLSQLVPDYLAKLPTDRMDSQPLRYRLEPDGTFTLYSVGTDLVDQGGVAPANPDTQPLRSWTMQPDWVWPTLATTKEIEEFEAQQAEKNNKKALRRRPAPKPSSTNPVQQPTAPAP